MTRTVLLGAGVAASAAALLVPSAHLVSTLDPGASGAHREALLLGAALFRAGLLLHGAVAIAAAVLRVGEGPAPAPLWRPARREEGALPPAAAVAGLGGVLALATVLRFVALDEALWIDEVGTLVDFVRLPFGQVLTRYGDDNNHLLYSLLAWLSIAGFGEGPEALRLPAVVLGVASLWAVWRLGKLAASEVEGLLAAALLAVSYHHVWFSQNARGYTGLLLGTTLATELLLRALRDGRVGTWAGYAAVTALTLWVHLTAVFVVAAQAAVVLFLLVRERAAGAAWARAAGGFALAALFTFQLHALVLPQMAGFYTGSPDPVGVSAPEWKSPIWLMTETLRGLVAVFPFGIAGLLTALAVGGAGLFGWLRRDPAATALFLLPAVLGAATLLLLGRNLWPRFFFNEAGFAALIGIRGVVEIGVALAAPLRFSPRRAALAVGALAVAASAAMLPAVYRHPKQDLIGARDFVARERGPDDRVVVVGLAAAAYLRYYAPEWTSVDSLEELRELRDGSGATWVVYTLPRQLAATKPQLMNALETEFELVRVFPGTLGDGAVIVRRRAGNPR